MHHAAAPERTALVENLLCGQQGPKALYALPDGHAHLLSCLMLGSYQHSYCMYITMEFTDVKDVTALPDPLHSIRKEGDAQECSAPTGSPSRRF